MSVLKATRTTQWPVTAEFTWSWDDTMLNTSGASTDFKTAAAHVVDCIPLPVNAIVVGGELSIETTFATVTTYAIIVGDATSTNRYLATADRKAAGRTALVPTDFVSNGENIRLTITPTGADATAGKGALRVSYIIRGRATEVLIV